jgi:hypothetical protein
MRENASRGRVTHRRTCPKTKSLLHTALTNLLLEHVSGRAVTVCWTVHRRARIDFDDLTWERKPCRALGQLRAVKARQLPLTAELQQIE